MTRFHALLALLSLGLVPFVAKAQVTPSNDAAFSRFMVNTVGAGQNTVNFSTSGSPLSVVSPSTLVTDGTANATLTRSGSLVNPAGNPYTVTAKGLVKPATFAPLLVKAAKVLPAVGVGIALYDLLKEVGVTASKLPDGSTYFERETTGTQCTTNCIVEYSFSYLQFSVWSTSKSSVCASLASYKTANSGAGYTWTMTGVSATCDTIGTRSGLPSSTESHAFTTRNSYQPGTTTQPMTQQEVIDAIATKSGWPSSSNLSKAINQSQQLTGDQVKLDTPTVTGPATSPGTSSTTTNPDGTKQVVTNTYNHTYQGDKITTTVTTTTQNINSSNVVTSTTTNTSTAPSSTPESPDASPTDTPLPGQPDLYTKKYPDGPAGVWAQKKSAILATPIAQLPNTLMPIIPAAGSYPSWPIPIVIGQWNFGTFNASPAPLVWDFLKVCVMVTALFLARALIFGG